jgi:hypothetical protein
VSAGHEKIDGGAAGRDDDGPDAEADAGRLLADGGIDIALIGIGETATWRSTIRPVSRIARRSRWRSTNLAQSAGPRRRLRRSTRCHVA